MRSLLKINLPQRIFRRFPTFIAGIRVMLGPSTQYKKPGGFYLRNITYSEFFSNCWNDAKVALSPSAEPRRTTDFL